MKIEDQVCSLEQAKILKKLEIKQYSVHSWIHKGDYYCGEEYVKEGEPYLNDVCFQEQADFPYRFDGSAFSVAELGLMLNKEVRYCFFHNPSQHWTQEKPLNPNMFKTQAECYANWLIHCLQNNILTSEECNKRL